jgi:hypothetical protein
MATKTRGREHREARAQQDRERDQPARQGDVLGISDTEPGAPIPQHKKPGGGTPEGIDVRDHATGIGDVSQTPGAVGIDMGGGGEGTGISPESKRPRSADPDEDGD